MLKNEESVMVFTYKSKNTLLKYNGSQSWKLDPKRVMKCKYLICVNNSKHTLSENLSDHGHAFLICKISNVKKTYGTVSSDRWIIEFSEYAEINIPNYWKGWRNPVVYTPSSEIENLSDIKFQEVPKIDLDFIKEHGEMEKTYHDNIIRSSNQINENKKTKNTELKDNYNPNQILTIEQAKIGLSNKYDIPVDKIEIILRG